MKAGILVILVFYSTLGLCNPIISGLTAVTAGQVTSYTYNDGTVYSSFGWTFANNLGHVLSSTFNSSQGKYTAVIQWDAAGTETITFTGDGISASLSNISISCPSLTTPDATFTYPNGTSVCGTGAQIIFEEEPPAGMTWFWQTSDVGTSKANSAGLFMPSTSGTYYLRANCGTTWGPAKATSYITINPIPTVSASDQTICTGMTTSISLTNNLSGTINGWTANATNVSGATNSSNSSVLAQTLSLISSTSGAVVYTITPSLNGCNGSAVSVTATVFPPPTVSAPNQNIFSTQHDSIRITNTNNIVHTSFNWTVTQSNTSGANSGSGALISQTLSTTSAANGSAVYTITPSANGCSGTPVTSTVNVFPFPVITAPQNNVAKGLSVTLDAGSGYDTYVWKNPSGTVVGSTQTYTTSVTGNYTVTVTKSGARATTLPFSLGSQFSNLNMNYIVTNTPLTGISDTTLVKNSLVDSVNQVIVYYDGLGRPFQNVVTQASPMKYDLVTPMAYDNYNREPRKYLPVSLENTGRYKTGLLVSGNYSGTSLNYNNATVDKVTDDTRAFSETGFEASPLSRPLQTFGPGQVWKDNSKSVNHQYLVNDSTDVRLFIYDPTTGLVSTGSGGQPLYYVKGHLYANVTTDEHGNDVIEYVDKNGRTVCKKVQYKTDAQNNKLYASTYYIYDDTGNLMVVLPPEAIKSALGVLTGN